MSFENWIAARQPTKRCAFVTQPTRRLSAGQAALSEYFLERGNLVLESKQALVSIGFPEVVAKLFVKRFGKHAYLVGRWFRENRIGFRGEKIGNNWWQQSGKMFGQDYLKDLVYLHQSATDPESYQKALEKLEISSDNEVHDEYFLSNERRTLEDQIDEELSNETFFKVYAIVKDIGSGKLKDVKPYEDLSIDDAQHKYDEKNIFNDKQPYKTYPNGFKWIDVGKRCNLVGSMMRNCGSVGVMSSDVDSTMLALFDANNKAHAVVTYSPNQQRISGDQGGASSALKPEYHDYVLDLAKSLGARFDATNSKSPHLRLKYELGDKATNVEQLPNSDDYQQIFTFDTNRGRFYSDGKVAVSVSDIQKASQSSIRPEFPHPSNDPLKDIFSFRNQPLYRQSVGIVYIPIDQI